MEQFLNNLFQTIDNFLNLALIYHSNQILSMIQNFITSLNKNLRRLRAKLVTSSDGSIGNDELFDAHWETIESLRFIFIPERINDRDTLIHNLLLMKSIVRDKLICLSPSSAVSSTN